MGKFRCFITNILVLTAGVFFGVCCSYIIHPSHKKKEKTDENNDEPKVQEEEENSEVEEISFSRTISGVCEKSDLPFQISKPLEETYEKFVLAVGFRSDLDIDFHRKLIIMSDIVVDAVKLSISNHDDISYWYYEGQDKETFDIDSMDKVIYILNAAKNSNIPFVEFRENDEILAIALGPYPKDSIDQIIEDI